MPLRKTPDVDGDLAPVIAIIGLGETGVAMGHALQAIKTRYTLVGHDAEAPRVRAALDGGAIDRGCRDPADAVAAADLVVLCEPLDALCATLEAVAPHARPGTLITDTATLKAPVMAAAARCVPAGVTFIGGHPIPRQPSAAAGGPMAGDGAPEGRAGAVFRGATYCLCPLAGGEDAALEVLRSLVLGIGAQPYFIDPAEHDALVTGTATLPALLGAALLRVLDASPSSFDLQRLTGRPLQALFDLAAGPDASESRPAPSAVDTRAAVTWLDRVVADLAALRPALEAGDAAGIAAWLAAADRALPGWRAPARDDIAGQGAALDDAARDNPLTRLLFGQRRRR